MAYYTTGHRKPGLRQEATCTNPTSVTLTRRIKVTHYRHTNGKNPHRGWRDAKVIYNTGCSGRGLLVGSLHSRGGSQASESPDADLTPSSGPRGQQAHLKRCFFFCPESHSSEVGSSKWQLLTWIFSSLCVTLHVSFPLLQLILRYLY